MPSCPRGEIVCLGEVGVYHCWSRCVRRACLCGTDPLTGNDYEYRRDWIREVEETLAGLFAVEIGFHAEQSNHIHLVVRIRPDVAAEWTDEQVVRRWLSISHLVKSQDGQLPQISAGQIAIEMSRAGRIAELRNRLSDPSFFMGALCEHVGRRSNREDGCTGHFWEDRYKCRALLDEAAIVVCGIYVDLNQIRAGEAQTPESSRHTSAHDRIAGRQQRRAAEAEGNPTNSLSTPDGWLCELTIREGPDADIRDSTVSATGRRASDKGLLPLALDDYLQLLDASGRIVRDDKSGSIPDHLAPILERLGIQVDLWSQLVTRYHDWFGHVVGASQKVIDRAAAAGRRWYRGQPRCGDAFG